MKCRLRGDLAEEWMVYYIHVKHSNSIFIARRYSMGENSNNRIRPEDLEDGILLKDMEYCASGYENVFRGLLFCPDCGKSMLVHTDGRLPEKPLMDKAYFQCRTYRTR